jgi:hypothetical protein
MTAAFLGAFQEGLGAPGHASAQGAHFGQTRSNWAGARALVG